jgi:glycosyltransferase involved in cell wall biosynthesis
MWNINKMFNMNSFLVIVPVYNSKYIGRCIESILSQEYHNKNYKIIIVDDCSTDDTWDIIKKYGVPANRNRVHRGSAIENIIKGIKTGSDNDIIICIDGDDYLPKNDVFGYLNAVYTDNVWLTYGQYTSLSGKFENICQRLDHINTCDIIGNRVVLELDSRTYRQSKVWCTSHLRTFRKWLFDRIKKKDLRDAGGNYFRTGWDLAMMYPMIEMAGDKHIIFIDKIMYVYDDMNNNYGSRAEENMKNAEYIQSKPLYNEYTSERILHE